MSSIDIEQITSLWANMSKFVHVIQDKKDYQATVSFLDGLIDTVGEDEKHPLASLMTLLGVLIGQYEDLHVAQL